MAEATTSFFFDCYPLDLATKPSSRTIALMPPNVAIWNCHRRPDFVYQFIVFTVYSFIPNKTSKAVTVERRTFEI
jgi:hypothetical protein